MDNEIDDIKKIQAIYKYMVDKNMESITFNRSNDEKKHVNIYNIDAIINGEHKTAIVNKKERKTFGQKLFTKKKSKINKDEQNQLIKDLINDIYELKQKFKEVTTIIRRNDEHRYNFLSGIFKILSPALSTLEKSIKD
jgi:hypothetical protein